MNKLDLMVTKGDGIELPDQNQAIKDFKRQCIKIDGSEIIEVPVISETFPVVLYLGTEDDREELIQALMEIHPNMRSRKL